MSSSDEVNPPHRAEPADGLPYGWEEFDERPAPADPELVSPAAEMGAALQLHRSALNAERGRAQTALDQALDMAYDQVVLLARWDAALSRNRDALADAGLGKVHQEFRLLKDDALELLRRGGVTFDDPSERPLADVEDRVEVQGWRYGPEYTAEVVARTIDPIVLHHGAVVRPGLVVMGAPDAAEEPAADNPDTTNDHDGKATR